jgi:methyl-accepting chemotaxis protein
MKFRSIQTTIATLAGASILAIVVALILYALYASGRSQELTQARTQDLLEQVIKQRLSALAQTQTLQIQAELEYPLMITAELANTNRLLGLKTEDGSAMLSMSREELNNLAREILVQHPKLLGSYIGWTVNGLDDSDAIYAGIGNPAVNESGRFIPWWYRNDDGSLAQELLTDLENEKPLPTGVRAGEYCLCPRDAKKACVIDPAPYEMGGKMVMLASFVSPILIDGTFKGMVGADLGVNFIRDLLVNADNQLYDGAGEMALI